jgi:hypothetical protein
VLIDFTEASGKVQGEFVDECTLGEIKASGELGVSLERKGRCVWGELKPPELGVSLERKGRYCTDVFLASPLHSH